MGELLQSSSCLVLVWAPVPLQEHGSWVGSLDLRRVQLSLSPFHIFHFGFYIPHHWEAAYVQDTNQHNCAKQPWKWFVLWTNRCFVDCCGTASDQCNESSSFVLSQYKQGSTLFPAHLAGCNNFLLCGFCEVLVITKMRCLETSHSLDAIL